ncbi:MAG: LysR family transcriptional regulator [Lautropia sp.]|nr:LysR family transcriptional regulator [Lautropia sp.]
MNSALRRLTLDQLRSFVLIAEHRSFTTAAHARQRTQTALSRQISSLEDLLGERLFERARGHVVGLTPAGQRLLPHGRRILATVDEAWESLQQPALGGRIRVGVMDDVNVRWLNTLLGQFHALHPDCEVQAISDFSSRLAARLEQGELDVALLKQLQGSARTPDERLLHREPLVWARGTGFSWEATRPLPLVLFHEGCAYRGHLMQQLARLGIPTRIAYEGQSYGNVTDAVFSGLGITALPRSQLEASGLLPCPRLADVLLPSLKSVDIVVRRRAGGKDAALDSFLAALRGHGRGGYGR